MMKIVQINTFPNKAPGTIMMNIHESLLKAGEESFVIWGRGRNPDNNREFKIENKWGVMFHGVYTRIFDKTGYASRLATRRLCKILDKVKPDIVHLHNIHGYYVNIEMLFKYIKKRKVKVVWTFHDCWPMTGHCAYFDMVGCNKWETGCHNCKFTRTYPISFFKDNSEKNWEYKKKLFDYKNMTIVCPSNWLKEIVRRSFFKNNQIVTIYNGIDLEVFKSSNCKKENIVLGVANEWTDRKGLKDYLSLRKILREDYKILLVGLNDRQIKMLPDGVEGINRTADLNELINIYSKSKICLNLSYEETMGMTTVEAMACGTPVISYNDTALPEIISEDVGFCVEKGDITMLNEKIEELLRNYSKFQGKCRSFAEKYNVIIQNDNYYNLYKNMYENFIE